MDPERWSRLTELFHQARDREPERRETFLDDAGAADRSLRDEVVSLLAYHEQANQMLDRPAALAMRDASDEAESLVGHSLDQYRVTKRLGAGGMGVVYLADDTRLGRQVAVKMLTRRFTQDAERRERLRREARAAAALSHPRIATVHVVHRLRVRRRTDVA